MNFKTDSRIGISLIMSQYNIAIIYIMPNINVTSKHNLIIVDIHTHIIISNYILYDIL